MAVVQNAPAPLNLDQKIELITRGIPAEDVQGLDAMRAGLQNEQRKCRCLWVTSPTGKPHVGYYVPILKFADILQAGCEIVIVLLDVYSYLDNVEHSMEKVRQRMYYYKHVILAAIESVGLPTENIHFVEESSYHYSKRWVEDQWRLCTLVPQQAVKDAWDRSYRPDMLSPMFCPGIQTLAEEHLDVDFQFGGEDQRGIFKFAENFLPQLGYRERGHIMNPMIPNLHGGKMSSSHPPETKIMFLDDEQAVKDKVHAAPWNGVDANKNGVLCLLKNVLIPVAKVHMAEKGQEGPVCAVWNDDKRHEFQSYDEVEEALENERITPEGVKTSVAKGLNKLLGSVRKSYETNAEWQANDKAAYP